MRKYSYQRVLAEGVDLLNQLRQVFARAFGENGVWNSQKPSDEYLKRVLADSNYIALVAVDENEKVVGGLIGYVLQKIDQEQSEVYLYDLAVEASHRRQGIATQLILELRTLARLYEAYVIFVQADNEDTEAVALYSRLCRSIETEITHFDISVDSQDAPPIH